LRRPGDMACNDPDEILRTSLSFSFSAGTPFHRVGIDASLPVRLSRVNFENWNTFSRNIDEI